MWRSAVTVVGVLLCGCQLGGIVDPSAHNRPPTAEIVAPAIAREGSPVPFSSDRSSDPDGEALRFGWSFGDGVTLQTDDPSVDHTYRNNGSYTVTLIVSDSRGAADTASVSITIANVEPQITLLRIPDTAVTAGDPFEIEVRYADPGLDDTLRAMIWVSRPGYSVGQGIPGPGTVSWMFWDPDQYSIRIVVWDHEGGITERSADRPLVVVAPPSAHIVAGSTAKPSRGS